MHPMRKGLVPAASECPRAYWLLRSLSKEGILDWLFNYPIGRDALKALEGKLNERLG